MALDPVLRTYDPKLYNISFKGIPIVGFSDGTFWEVSSEDAFESKVGADGTEDRTNKNQYGVDGNITIKQTSLTNDALSAVHIQDKLLNNGVGEFLVKDLGGTTVVSSAQAYIKKLPDTSKSDSSENNTWNFRLTNVTRFTGGNIV